MHFLWQESFTETDFIGKPFRDGGEADYPRGLDVYVPAGTDAVPPN